MTHRHPVLRSRFLRTGDGKAYQVFHKEMKTPVYYRDLSSLSEDARERFLKGFFQAMEEDGALFAAGCFPDTKNSCDLLICTSHTLLDGISATIVINELTADELPSGTDVFYEWRERLLADKDRIPGQLSGYYKDFGERMLLSSGEGGGSFQVHVREITFDRVHTEAILRRCAKEAVSLVTFAEYCYGKGLLQATGRDWLWFSHLYSGRDPELTGSDVTTGNLFYTMPVRIRGGMCVQEFQEQLLIPWQYPYSTENALYRRLNSWRVEEGIVSNTFTGFGENVLTVQDFEENQRTGHSMRLKEGCLSITLRYLDGPKQNAAYDIIEQVLRRMPERPSPDKRVSDRSQKSGGGPECDRTQRKEG